MNTVNNFVKDSTKNSTNSKITNFKGCGHTINIFSPETMEHIKVNTHVGAWYVIERKYYDGKGAFYLCEHETYGDETACIIIDEDYDLIMDDVWNGFDDLEDAWDWETYEKEMFSVLKERHLEDSIMDGSIIQHTVLYRIKFESKEYNIMLLETVINKDCSNIGFFYQENKPNRWGILEEKLKDYYKSTK